MTTFFYTSQRLYIVILHLFISVCLVELQMYAYFALPKKSQASFCFYLVHLPRISLMKNILLLFLLIGFCNHSSFGQTIKYLDQKNGIKDFKIGDSYERWSEYIEPVNPQQGVYKYTGSGCKEIFGRKVTSVILVFASGRLIAINVKTADLASKNIDGSYNINYGNYVEEKLIGLFGKPLLYDKKGDANYMKHKLQWTSKKLILQVKVNYGSKNDGKQDANFWLIDKRFIDKGKYFGV